MLLEFILLFFFCALIRCWELQWLRGSHEDYGLVWKALNKTLYMYNSNPAKFHDGACRVLRELTAGTLGIGERTVCRAGD